MPATVVTMWETHGSTMETVAARVAEILGIPAATVRTRLRRGRELLKKKLMEAEGYAGQENV